MWAARVRLTAPSVPPGPMVPPERGGLAIVTPPAGPLVVAAAIIAVGLSGWLMVLLAG
jgi:hypothetical protein